MNENHKKNLKKTGRKPKADPANIRYSISFNQEEHSKFLALFDQSGMQVKAHFIISCIFQNTIKTIKVDKGTIDFYMRLTNFHSQFRAIGINYNQLVKQLYTSLTERKAATLLFTLEKQTAELSLLCKKIIELIHEFEGKHLNKNL